MSHQESEYKLYVRDANDPWFHLVPGNRPLDRLKLERMEAALKEGNWLHLFPIVVDKNGGILDGQHRLVVARKLGLSIHYLVDDDYSIMDVAATVSNVSAWEAPDYLNFWVCQNAAEYLEIDEFVTKYPRFSINNILRISRNSWSAQQATFRHGTYEWIHKELCQDVAKLLTFLCDEVGVDWVWQRNAMLGLSTLVRHPEFDETRFRDRASRYSYHIEKRPAITDYEYMWQDLYNLHFSTKNRVSFRRVSD